MLNDYTAQKVQLLRYHMTMSSCLLLMYFSDFEID